MGSGGRVQRLGYLLLEVLIAAGIFTFVVASAAATASYHERALRKHENRNAATFLAQQEMESLLAESYARLPLAVAEYPLDIEVERTIDESVVKATYHCEATLTTSPDRTLRTVVVEVGYPEGNETRTVVLETDVFWSR